MVNADEAGEEGQGSAWEGLDGQNEVSALSQVGSGLGSRLQ